MEHILKSIYKQKRKNLWGRKCFRRTMEASTFTLFATRPLSHCVTLTGRPTAKMNTTFFIRSYMLNIFYSTIFSKKAVFLEKTEKNCFGDTFDDFLQKKGKRGVLLQKLT